MGAQPQRPSQAFGLRRVLLARREYRDGRRLPADVGHLGGGLATEAVLTWIADRQHGIATAGQLRTAGLSKDAILRLVSSGRLKRLHRGVYAIGRADLPYAAILAAGVLAVGPWAVLTHRSALELWGALPACEGPVHVLSPSARARRPGLSLHRLTTSLAAADLCAIDFIPLTAPARSLLDFAPNGQPDDLERALNELRATSLLRPSDLEELRGRSSGHHGWGLLNRLLAAELEPDFSRSEAERLMLRLIRDAELPEPRRNVRIHGWEVDFFWPDHGLVVEIDGYAFHSGRQPFERDRRKQAALQDHELEVLRFTWRQIRKRPLWVAARLAGRLAARRRRP